MSSRAIFTTICAVVVIVSATAFPGCTSSRSTGGPWNMPEMQVNEDVVATLREMVALCEEQLDVTQAKHEIGRASSSELEEAQTKLSETLIQLAMAQRQPDVVIAELRKILAIREQRVQRARRRVAQRLASSSDMVEAKRQMLEARIRLATAIQEMK